MNLKLTRIDQQPLWDALCPEWKIQPAPAPRSRIVITPQKSILNPGDEAVFAVSLLTDGQQVSGKKLDAELLRDFHLKETFSLTTGLEPVMVRTSLEQPGFIRLAVSGEALAAESGIGYAPQQIAAAPEVWGFDAFWQKQKARLIQVPMTVLHETKVALDMSSYEGKVECFDVRVACAGNMPVSGMLARPVHAAPKSLPAYIFFHGAGVRPAFQPLPWAAKGMLAFNVNAHGLPNGKADAFYTEARNTTLKDCEGRTYTSPEDSLFCDMTLRVIRALEYLKSRPEWDGRTLVVHGGSQGGYQSLAACALDHDVTFAVIAAPAMCNLAGALEGRTPSWPGTVLPQNDPVKNRAACFCDGASFARRGKCEAIFTVGFSDPAAVPSSVYAAFNVYGGPGIMQDFTDLGHSGAVFWTGEAEIAEHIRKMQVK